MADTDNTTGAGGYLVYVKSAGHVCPQWWPELYFGERGDRRGAVVAIFPLDEAEADLSIDDLVRRHPLSAGGCDDE